mgnify:FL=1|tara:strand:- start:22 stop:459 length:438 start_codon:yes stop_codon:yes gene_type:complete
MEEIKDPLAKKLLKEFIKLNWKGFKLYLVGSLVEGWKTKDIDVVITGKGDNKQLFNSMEAARKLGPFDMYYTKNKLVSLKTGPFKMKFAKSYDRVHRWYPRKGEWIDGLFWQTLNFPIKHPITGEVKHAGKEYTKDPLLIYDGTV